VTQPEAGIAAITYAVPAREVTNEDLAREHPDWRMAVVARRTGVLSRRWCEPHETALDLAVTASAALFERVARKPEDVDAILFCTQTPDFVMPPNACLLQARLGIPSSAAALDFSLACSGFLYGLYLARGLICSGSARTILLVTAETYSKLFSPDDRGPATLFGDGAAATLITDDRRGIGPVVLGTDGSAHAMFYVPAGGTRHPSTPETCAPVTDRFGNRRSAEQLVMHGAAVLAFVDREVVPFVRRAMAQLSVRWADLDLAVFHQASRATLELLATRLDVPADKMFSNLERVGNTVSASIPMALRDAADQGRLQSGAKVLVVGFGVGMSWGACVLTWNAT
jgi:3-oxoacyl-[acyl-carrier-protein] synthase-3